MLQRLRLLLRNYRLKKRQRYALKIAGKIDENVSIISSNCLGGIIYHDLGLKFLSPTINLTFSMEDFLYFAEHLNELNECTLIRDETKNAKYPMGYLKYPNGNNIKIQFVHYSTFDDAKEKFLNRLNRIKYEKIVLLFCAAELKQDIAIRFSKIPAYKKLCIYKTFSGNFDLKEIVDCDFLQLFAKVPKNKDLLNFKGAFSRKLYIDDSKFDYYSYIFKN